MNRPRPAETHSAPPLTPAQIRLIMIGVVLGMLLGLAYALIRKQFDRRLRRGRRNSGHGVVGLGAIFREIGTIAPAHPPAGGKSDNGRV